MMEITSGENVQKLQRWIASNIEDWYTICGVNGKVIDYEEFRRLRGLLKANNFHEMFLVLATCHFYVIKEDANELIFNFFESLSEYLKEEDLD